MNRITKAAADIRTYWKTPPPGRYMPYREILSLSVGGIGQKFIVYCVSQMILSVGNVLIGNTIGIEPSALYAIYILSVLSGFPLTALRASLIDNTRSMKGKYRPYLLTMGIPTVLLGVGFILAPYETMGRTAKCATVLAFNVGFQFFYNFYTDAYDSLVNVLSPNSIERSDLLSVRSVIENLSPSIAGIFLPIAAKLITGENTLYNLKVYRALFPPMLFAGFLISMLAYVNTREKIVQAKTHVIRVRFSDAFRSVARNKYFWIISLAGWLGFLEGAFGSVMGWMYNYQNACTAGQYSLITAVAGNASFWPNLVGPFFIRRYGKKKVLVVTNLLNIGFIALMLPIVRNVGGASIWLLLVCNFVNQFITSLGHLLGPSIQADIRDYQQYITGERIDGMFAAVGLIGNVITLLTGSVLPTLYERAGLNAATAAALGKKNVYDVLYDRGYFIKISSVLVCASVVGAAMNVIPFFFYDLTETDQWGMVAVLKLRALAEDAAGGVKPDSLREVREIIDEALTWEGASPHPLDKTALRAAKKRRDKAAVADARQALRRQREENVRIAAAPRILAELRQFETPQGALRLSNARAVTEKGLAGFSALPKAQPAEAKRLPRRTAAERAARREAIRAAAEARRADRAAAKYYPNGIEPFDDTAFSVLFEAENDAENGIAAALFAIKQAKERGDRAAQRELRENLRELRERKKTLADRQKRLCDDYAAYVRAIKPYADALQLIRRSEVYAKLIAGEAPAEK